MLSKYTGALSFWCIAFLVFPCSHAQAGSCPRDITAYWRLDEGGAGNYQDDIAGDPATCSLQGCPLPIPDGVVSRAQLFDGSSRLYVAPAAAFNWPAARSFTIEIWVRPDNQSSGVEVFIGRAGAPGPSWFLGVNESGYAQAQLTDALGATPGVLTSTTDPKNLRANATAWHHVALVRNAQTNLNYLYVDGREEKRQAGNYTAGFASADAPLTMGMWDGDHFFHGALDEAALYNRALDAAEIRSHYYIARQYCDLFDTPIRVMPLGDSITSGINDGIAVLPAPSLRIGYRYDLWELLKNNLFDCDFIGSEYYGQLVDPLFDPDNAGFGGMTDDEMLTLLATGRWYSTQIAPGPYLNTFPPEVILLHIGTNDRFDSVSTPVQNILNQIDTYNKNVTVLLARIIDQVPSNPNVSPFNDAVQTMAEQRITQGDKIIMVDMQTGAGLNYRIDTAAPYDSGDMYDQWHPNASGYNKMAGKWFATLDSVLPRADVPEITSVPVTEAAKDQPYAYKISGVGPPDPTYQLINGPSGMTVQAASGWVQWTPSAVGDYTVTVRALNWAGSAQQSFTITVVANNLPVAVNDEYANIASGQGISVSAADGVLKNDSDPDPNDHLSAILVSDISHGVLAFNADGSFAYTHDGSDNLTDQFTYMASDGKGESSPATVTLTISPAVTPDSGGGGGGGGGGCFITGLTF